MAKYLSLKPTRICHFETCIMSGCGYKRYARGLCKSHYDKAQYLIGEGIETWESLEEKKLSLKRKGHDE